MQVCPASELPFWAAECTACSDICLFCLSSIWCPDPILAQQIQELLTYKSSAICFAIQAQPSYSCLLFQHLLRVDGVALGFQLCLP